MHGTDTTREQDGGGAESIKSLLPETSMSRGLTSSGISGTGSGIELPANFGIFEPKRIRTHRPLRNHDGRMSFREIAERRGRLAR